MNKEKAIKILKDHQAWRRGGDGLMIDPKLLGLAIDWVINETK